MDIFYNLAGIALVVTAVAFCFNGFTFVQITHIHNAKDGEGGEKE